jgi:site-specific DNA recombinase
MRVGLYARVSTEQQGIRGSIGSQLEALRAWAVQDAHAVVGEFTDDGYSGATLNRPGLDALRDGAEQGTLDAVLCLTPDRLARAYAYQVLVMDELQRHGVRVLFRDAPELVDDSEVRLLTQVQGVIAEYERAKIAERCRRGRLFRARAGEPVDAKVAYGYRRVARTATSPARLEVFEPEAEVVRRIFDDYVAGGHSMRRICWRLHEAGILSPTGRRVWTHPVITKVLHSTTYVGTLYANRYEYTPRSAGGRRRKRLRPPTEWITIPVPAIVTQDVFDAAQRITHVNWKFSPRRVAPGHGLLRGLVRCGHCNLSCTCTAVRNSSSGHLPHHYYICPRRDALRAGGEDRRCRAPSIRAAGLDDFVFEQVRDALLRPQVLLDAESALAARAPAPDDELVATQLGRLTRRLASAAAERGRLVDLFQAGLIPRGELDRRVRLVDERHRQLDAECSSLREQRHELARGHQLHDRVGRFADQVLGCLDHLDFDQRQRLLRLVIEDVRVTGATVEIRMRIPLDDPSDPGLAGPPTPSGRRPSGVSTNDGLRSLTAVEAPRATRSVAHTGPAERLHGWGA